MHARPLLVTALAAATLLAVPTAAGAGTVEQLDRRTFDPSPVVTDSTIHLAGATAGPLGGFLDLTVRAQDGTLPTAPGACDAADVEAVLTVSPGETLTVSTTGEVCMHRFSTTLTVLAYFDKKDATWSGTEHRKAKVVGDGLVSASNGVFSGFGASVSAALRW